MSILSIVSGKWSHKNPTQHHQPTKKQTNKTSQNKTKQKALFSLPIIAVKMFVAANWYWTNLILTVAQVQHNVMYENCISFAIQAV